MTKRTFTITGFILSLLPSAKTGGTMFIIPHPLSRQVTIPGLDVAYFMDRQQRLKIRRLPMTGKSFSDPWRHRGSGDVQRERA